MAQPFNETDPVRKTYFINESERSVDPADDEGKLVQLENDGKVSGEFLRDRIVRTYTSSDTWTKPDGLRGITVEVQAPGGNGGSTTTSDEGASGGGSGGYSKSLYIPASLLGATETVTIGSTTSFTVTSGTDLVTTAGTSAARTTQGDGGTATGGDINVNGQVGYEGTDGAGEEVGGAGASSILGIGGSGRLTTGGGSNATGFGAGGGGAVTTGGGGESGGGGAPGIIVLTEHY